MSRVLRLARLTSVALLAASIGCGDATAPRQAATGPSVASVPLHADVAQTTVAAIVARVSASDIASPLVFNFPVAGTVASGSMTLPVGINRTVVFTAYDAAGVPTHQGQVAGLTVVAGPNPALTVTMAPVQNGVGIEVAIGYALRVSPAGASLRPGETIRLVASFVDAAGTLTSPRDQGVVIRWASLNSARAFVDTAGVVTALDVGPVDIAAVAGGAASRATLTVGQGASTTWSSVAAGSAQSCGIASGSALYCWGANGSGNLGLGIVDGLVRQSPVAVPSLTTTSVVALGGGHACAIDALGHLFCWGRYLFGELGVGTAVPASCVTQGSETACPSPLEPVPGTTFKSLAVGTYHSCAVNSSGGTLCWGDNSAGELGAATSSQCAFGSYPVDCAPSPVQLSTSTAFAAVSAGAQTTCGLTSAGAAYCWGLNGRGQVGTAPRTTLCRANMNPAADTPCEKLPVAVGGALAFSKIAPGPQHSCGVTTDGRLFCWGDNSAAQLGLGTIDGLVHSAPVKASLGALSGATFRDVGVSLFTCALTTTGAVWCWGGAFGTAPTSPVSGALRFASLSVGAVHACGVTTAGIGYCWGPTTDANSYGQFGSGSTHYSFTPAPIANRAVQ